MRVRPCHGCGTAFPWFAESCPTCRRARWESCEIQATALQAAKAEGPGGLFWDLVKLRKIDPDHVCTFAPIGIRNTETGQTLHKDEFTALRDADFNEESFVDDGQAIEASDTTDSLFRIVITEARLSATVEEKIIRPNAERNEWCYQQCLEYPDKKYREMRTEAKSKGWTLASDQAFRKAVKSHCDSRGLYMPIRKHTRTKPD